MERMSKVKQGRKELRREIQRVLEDHSVTYREWYWEGWDCHYKSICVTCDELPEGTENAEHQSKEVEKWLRSRTP